MSRGIAPRAGRATEQHENSHGRRIEKNRRQFRDSIGARALHPPRALQHHGPEVLQQVLPPLYELRHAREYEGRVHVLLEELEELRVVQQRRELDDAAADVRADRELRRAHHRQRDGVLRLELREEGRDLRVGHLGREALRALVDEGPRGRDVLAHENEGVRLLLRGDLRDEVLVRAEHVLHLRLLAQDLGVQAHRELPIVHALPELLVALGLGPLFLRRGRLLLLLLLLALLLLLLLLLLLALLRLAVLRLLLLRELRRGLVRLAGGQRRGHGRGGRGRRELRGPPRNLGLLRGARRRARGLQRLEAQAHRARRRRRARGPR